MGADNTTGEAKTTGITRIQINKKKIRVMTYISAKLPANKSDRTFGRLVFFFYKNNPSNEKGLTKNTSVII